MVFLPTPPGFCGRALGTSESSPHRLLHLPHSLHSADGRTGTAGEELRADNPFKGNLEMVASHGEMRVGTLLGFINQDRGHVGLLLPCPPPPVCILGLCCVLCVFLMPVSNTGLCSVFIDIVEQRSK